MEMINNVERIKKFKEEKFSKIFDIEKVIFDTDAKTFEKHAELKLNDSL